MDWTVELDSPAKFYQHCLPEVFRHINSVTDTVSNPLPGKRPKTIDQWDVVHFQSMTGEWDAELDLYKSAGFSSVFDAERMFEFGGYPEEYPGVLGYFDEGRVSFYVPRLICRESQIFVGICR